MAGRGLPRDARASDDDERGGRAQLVLGATLYGIWTGVAIDVLGGVDGDRQRVLFPMLGMVAGLGGSLVATRQGGITGGQAWSIITGLDYGTYNGLLWSAATDRATDKRVVGVALGAGLAGGAIGAVVAGYHPPQGGVELVRSGGLYGTGVALLAALLIAPDGASSKAIFTTVATGMDVGLAAGAILATQVPISRNRVLLVDAGTVAGAGLGLGTTWLIAGTHGDARRALGAGGLIGMGAGMAAAILLTRGLETGHQAAADAAPVPALATRDQAGSWRPGTLALVPVTASDNTRIIGASVPVVGGVW